MPRQLDENNLLPYFFEDRSKLPIHYIKSCEDFLYPIIKKIEKNSITKEEALKGVSRYDKK
tara:strand:+ start:2698 stop:2880 length:183 start_codon:yes stop_codon:yes gene_type:complete